MTSPELWQWSAVDLAAATGRGEVSARDAVQSAVDRMRSANPAINAVVIDRGDEAIADAARLDELPADERGILHGVPVTVKVNVDTEGYPNSNGVEAFAGNIAPGDRDGRTRPDLAADVDAGPAGAGGPRCTARAAGDERPRPA